MRRGLFTAAPGPAFCVPQDFDLTVEPVRVEDERSDEQVAGVEGLEDGEDVFQWLISPVSAETFYEAIHGGRLRVPAEQGAQAWHVIAALAACALANSRAGSVCHPAPQMTSRC